MILNYLFLVTLTITIVSTEPILPPAWTATASGSDTSATDTYQSIPGTNIINSLLSLKQAKASTSYSSNGGDVEELLNGYPYEESRDSVYGSVNFAPPQPAFGFAVNTKGLLAPHVEVLRLLEAFLKLKGEILARLYALYNDNYDLIRGVIGLAFKKLTHLQVFTLKGVSILRKVLEFALNLFADWTFTLPSVTFGGSTGGYARPHEIYGVPESDLTELFD